MFHWFGFNPKDTTSSLIITLIINIISIIIISTPHRQILS